MLLQDFEGVSPIVFLGWKQYEHCNCKHPTSKAIDRSLVVWSGLLSMEATTTQSFIDATKIQVVLLPVGEISGMAL